MRIRINGSLYIPPEHVRALKELLKTEGPHKTDTVRVVNRIAMQKINYALHCAGIPSRIIGDADDE